MQEILDFGLRGVARAELLEAIDAVGVAKNEDENGKPFFIAPN